MKKIILWAAMLLPLLFNVFEASAQYYAITGQRYAGYGWYERAFNEFKKGEAAGELESAAFLVNCYVRGVGTPRNFSKAADVIGRWYKKSPELCEVGMWLYIPDDLGSFVKEQEGWKPVMGSNMTMFQKYFKCMKDTHKYDVSDVEAYFYAFGKNGYKKDMSKAIRSKDGESFNDVAVSHILFYLSSEKTKVTIADIGSTFRELKDLGFNVFDWKFVVEDKSNALIGRHNLRGNLYKVFEKIESLLKKKYGEANLSEGLKAEYPNLDENTRTAITHLMQNHISYVTDWDIEEGLKRVRQFPSTEDTYKLWVMQFEAAQVNMTSRQDHENLLNLMKRVMSEGLVDAEAFMREPVYGKSVSIIAWMEKEEKLKKQIASQKALVLSKKAEFLQKISSERETLANSSEYAKIKAWYNGLDMSEKFNQDNYNEVSDKFNGYVEVAVKTVEYADIMKRINTDYEDCRQYIKSWNASQPQKDDVLAKYERAFAKLDFHWEPNGEFEILPARALELKSKVSEYVEVIAAVENADRTFAVNNGNH